MEQQHWNRDREIPHVTLPCLLRPEPPGCQQEEPDPHARVPVPVHPQLLASVDPLMRALLQSLIKTNIVCTSRLSGMCAIEQMALDLGAAYIPDKFPSCLGESDNPSASWTAFRKGYFRCAGGSTREKAELVLNLLAFRLFLQSRMRFRLYNFCVHNIVTAATLPYEINIQRLHELDPKHFDYKPDVFPGVMYRMKNPKLVIQIFDSGKLNIVGAKNISEPVEALLQLEPLLRKCRIFNSRLEHAPLLSSRRRPLGLPTGVQARPRAQDEMDASSSSSAAGVRIIDDRLVKQLTRFKDIVTSQTKSYRQNKKNEKAVKETKKKQQNERKALQSQQAMLLKRRQKEVGRTQKQDSKAVSQAMGGWSPHLSLLERDMLMITERLAEIPEDGLGEEEKAVFTLAIQIHKTHRPIVIELLADAKMNVLDADSEDEARAVHEVVEDLLQKCNTEGRATTKPESRRRKRDEEGGTDEPNAKRACLEDNVASD